MKPLLLLLPLALLAAAPAPPTVRVTFSPLSKAAYNAGAGCRDKKPRVTYPVRKQRARLVIPTTRGNRVLTDIVVADAKGNLLPGRGEADAITHVYRGYWPDWHCHLVEVQYYEMQKWLLLTDAGQQLELWGEPKLAPDGQHLVAWCQGLEYSGGQPNCLQLLARQPDGTLRQVWRIDPTTWEPAALCWTSPTTLALKKENWTAKIQGGVYTYARLTLATTL